MNTGLSEEQIEAVLEKSGIKPGGELDAITLKNAIAKAIYENNEALATSIKCGVYNAVYDYDSAWHRY